MQELLSPSGLSELKRFLVNRPFLAFDFDGTLAPIAADPQGVRLSPLTEALLRRLSVNSAVGIVSGRSLADLTSRMAGLERLHLAGNHGGEVEGFQSESRFGGGEAEACQIVDELLARVRAVKDLPSLAESALENKRLTVTFHWRRMLETDARAWAARIRQIASDLDGFRLLPGIQSLNLIPRGLTNKGEAVRELLFTTQRRDLLYVGDEETDEDVFRAAPGSAFLGVRVGKSAHSAAQWFLHDQSEVDRLLEVLLALVAGTAAGIALAGIGSGPVAPMESAFSQISLTADREA